MYQFIDITTKFILLQLLGQGTYGKVYEVCDKKNNNTYAMKMYHIKADAPDPTIIKEITVLKNIVHPHITKLYDVFFGQYNKSHYLCVLMEKYEIRLFEYINNNNTLSTDDMMNIFIKLLDGLKCLHDSGYSHCDLSLLNIMINSKHDPVIIDFGLSKRHYRQYDIELPPNISARPIELYTPINENCVYDISVFDSWALGCILYFMSQKEVMIVNKTMNKVVTKNTDEFRIIKKLIQHNPKKRPDIPNIIKLPEVQNYINANRYKFKPNTHNNTTNSSNSINNSTNNITSVAKKLLHIMKDNNIDSEVFYATIFNFTRVDLTKIQTVDNNTNNTNKDEIILFVLFWTVNNIISTKPFDINTLKTTYNFFTAKDITTNTLSDVFYQLCHLLNWDFDSNNIYTYIDTIPSQYQNMYKLISFANIFNSTTNSPEINKCVAYKALQKMQPTTTIDNSHHKVVSKKKLKKYYSKFVCAIKDIKSNDNKKALLLGYATYTSQINNYELLMAIS